MQYSEKKIISIIAPEEGMGGLSFFESGKDLPFEIKRIYYIYGVDSGRTRGMHMHKSLRQLMFCPYGEIELTFDNGHERETVRLDSPGKALLIEPGLWREIRWIKADSVLCVAASEYYNEEDYIRNYDDFLEYVRKYSK